MSWLAALMVLVQAGGNIAPASDCVAIRSGRLARGAPFAAEIGRGLEFGLVPSCSSDGDCPSWNIVLGQIGGMLDFLWVVSPPFRTSPQLMIGHGYGYS